MDRANFDGSHEFSDIQFRRLLAEGSQFAQAGNHAAALALYERALHVIPESVAANVGAALAALELGNLEAANDHFIFARHYDRYNPNVALGIARMRAIEGNPVQAGQILEEALSRNPEHTGLLYGLARNRHASGDYNEAVALLRRVLLISPNNANSSSLLGLILAREFGDLLAGEAEIVHALSHAPDLQAARSNLGWILAEQGRLGEALECFKLVLNASPDDAETKLMRGYAHLKHGEFALGWLDYEARHSSSLALPRNIPFIECSRQDVLSGKRVLVYAEQGLGDQIMFASCIPDLLCDGVQCVLECEVQLMSLFQRSFRRVTVVPKAADCCRPGWLDHAQSIDMKLAIGSLPSRFRNRWEDFPAHAGYLCADQRKVERWQKMFSDLGPGPHVGISWKGGTLNTRRQLRSIPLIEWQRLLSGTGQFISLQYGDCTTEVSEFTAQTGLKLHHFADALADYDETAAMICALDLVISVCTAVIHLTGALGKPVWILTPSTPEWRYLDQGNRMPWYPSARLFRQAKRESWESVLRRVESVLTVTEECR